MSQQGSLVHVRKVGRAWVCVGLCVCVWGGGGGGVGVLFFNLHVKALVKALAYMILWLNYNVMDVESVVMFYLVIVSDATNEFLPEIIKIYCIDLNTKFRLPVLTDHSN